MEIDDGRVPSEPGSREPSPPVSAASGFDPSRVAGYRLDAAVRMAEEISENLRAQIVQAAAEIAHDAETPFLARYLSERTAKIHYWAVNLSAWATIADSLRRDSGSHAERHDPVEGHGPKDGRAAEGIAQPPDPKDQSHAY